MNMKFFELIGNVTLHFLANPNAANNFYATNDLRLERMIQKIRVQDPGFPSDDPPSERPMNPTHFPTDVPAPEPHDVPVPEPMDPPPDPGEAPEPSKTSQRPKQDPKPRPIP